MWDLCLEAAGGGDPFPTKQNKPHPSSDTHCGDLWSGPQGGPRERFLISGEN